MDEPTSALDPISTSKIEDLMDDLRDRYTVVIVTHNMQQAARIADRTAFFLLGDWWNIPIRCPCSISLRTNGQSAISPAVSVNSSSIFSGFAV